MCWCPAPSMVHDMASMSDQLLDLDPCTLKLHGVFRNRDFLKGPWELVFLLKSHGNVILINEVPNGCFMLQILGLCQCLVKYL